VLIHRFCTRGTEGDNYLFEEIEQDIKKMLMEGEQILFVAKQSRIKPGGSLTTPNTIYITNRRVIFRNPKLFGLKKDYVDFDYMDISNVRMKKGIFSTEIFLKSRFLSDEVKLPAVDKKDAEQVFQLIRKGTRGELPGQIISEEKTAPIVEPARKKSPIEQLKELKELLDMGAITEAEYEEKKKKILAEI